MKKMWKKEAFSRIDKAVIRLKEQIMESKGDWESVDGEISLRVSRTVINDNQLYNVCTHSKRLCEFI